MLSFAVFNNGELAQRVNLNGAYVVGTDDVPLRAELSFKKGIISCKKHAAGPAGLVLLWEVPGAGTLLLETIRLPEREKPYTLQVEMARARLTRLNYKLEDWGLLDLSGIETGFELLEQAREALVRALQADDPATAASLGEESLALAIRSSEEITHFHADAMLTRRKQVGAFGRSVLGCTVPLDHPTEAVRKRLLPVIDFATVPIVWRDVEPREQVFEWKKLDTWVESLVQHKIPMKASTLLSFSERHVPDWLYIWEHDFDTIRDLAFDYARRVINRYGEHIQGWDVISGIHANNCFTFNFEQLMELTRMSASLMKQLVPRGVAIVDIIAPWGEYYARNQRTIPPLLYADMVVQSGVPFDAFGIQFHFGPAVDGMYLRDMFQISALLDLFAKMGKPLHITAVEVPSGVPIDPDADEGSPPAMGGVWREPWTEEIQSTWIEAFLEVALSKPFVESVTWDHLADNGQAAVPLAGLLHEDLTPKAAYNCFVNARSEILGHVNVSPS